MYRYYTDSWGVDSSTVRVGYNHPIGDRWIVEVAYRWYDQSAADFYSDLFPRADSQNFVGRDKELSTFQSQMFTSARPGSCHRCAGVGSSAPP